MIEKAQQEHNLDLSNSWVIGDRDSDILLGKTIGCKTIRVRTGFTGKSRVKPNYEAENLLEAVKIILSSITP